MIGYSMYNSAYIIGNERESFFLSLEGYLGLFTVFQYF